MTALGGAVAASPGAVGAPGTFTVDRTTMQAGAGTILRNDEAVTSDFVTGLWGDPTLTMVNTSRVTYFASGGDPHLNARGQAQASAGYRRANVVDGSYINNDINDGERTQLGHNTWSNGENTPAQTNGTFALFYEGDHRLIFWSMRFPDTYVFNPTPDFQQMMQLKQSQPYSNDAARDTTPGVALEIWLNDGLLILRRFWVNRWTTSTPLHNTWTRFAMDVTFSQDPAIGKVQVFADLDGDGDFLSASEASPVLTGSTLAYSTTGGSGIAAGGSIPSVLMLGCYRGAAISGDTYVDIDNVQVVGP